MFSSVLTSCCELLSICDLTIFDTPSLTASWQSCMLWIAFNLWFDDLWHTARQTTFFSSFVVNCFQFVIWRSLTHLIISAGLTKDSCELLSICDLTIFDTPWNSLMTSVTELWIAFNLWFDDLWHTEVTKQEFAEYVVNCFQFVIWRSLTHRTGGCFFHTWCCELLSICDLTIFDTPLPRFTLCTFGLWIAFNLWFDDLWHTRVILQVIYVFVVNCFQFVIWRSLTHRSLWHTWSPGCCELLSICDLTIFDTPLTRQKRKPNLLWIAFNLWFDDLWHTESPALQL